MFANQLFVKERCLLIYRLLKWLTVKLAFNVAETQRHERIPITIIFFDMKTVYAMSNKICRKRVFSHSTGTHVKMWKQPFVFFFVSHVTLVFFNSSLERINWANGCSKILYILNFCDLKIRELTIPPTQAKM